MKKISYISNKCRAVVYFNPKPQQTDIYALPPPVAGQFYQVTVDPNMKSPEGSLIRFGLYPHDELNGWQMVDYMVVAEILAETPDAEIHQHFKNPVHDEAA